MPAIQQYENPINGLQPDERGIDANLQAARRGGAFFNQAGQAVETVGNMEGRMYGSAIKDAGQVAVDFAEHQEKSHAAVATSAYIAQKTQEWNQRVSGVKNPDGTWAQKPIDGNDPTAAASFMDGVNTDLEKLQGGMLTEGGQRWMEAHSESIRNHFQTTTTAQMVELAGVAAKENAVKTVNNYSNAAVNDPAGVERYAKLAEDAIAAQYDSSPNLKGAAGAIAKAKYTAEATKQIYQSAAMSAIEKSSNPEATAAAFSKKYPDYINGAESLHLAKAAATQNRVNVNAEKQGRLLDIQIANEKVEKAATDVLARNVTTDATGRPVINPKLFQESLDILKTPNATKASEVVRSIINWGEAKQNEKDAPVHDDPNVKTGLLDKLSDHTTSPADAQIAIMRAELDKTITTQTGTQLRALASATEEKPFKNPVFTATRDSIKGMFGEGPIGHERYAQFMYEFLPAYIKDPNPKALDTKDPNSLVGTLVNKYRLTPQEKMQDAMPKIVQGALAGGASTDIITLLNPDAKPAPKPTVTLPPPNKREVDKVYPTPSGNKKWTGTGWVEP